MTEFEFIKLDYIYSSVNRTVAEARLCSVLVGIDSSFIYERIYTVHLIPNPSYEFFNVGNSIPVRFDQ
jgi:hypothetical protein